MADQADNADDRKAEAAEVESSAATQSTLVRDLRHAATHTCVWALAGLFFMIVQNEVAWYANTTVGFGRFCPDARDVTCDPRDAAMMFPVREEKLTLNIIRGVGITLPTAIALYFLTRYYQLRVEFMRSKNQLPPSAHLLVSPGLRWAYLFEALVLSVHTFPAIDDVYTGSPALYLALSQLMFLRWFFLIRVVRYRSELNSSNGRFIGALTNVEFNAGFILKTALKENPIGFMATVLALLVFSSAYAVRMIESLMCAWDRSLGCDPLDYWDALWLVVITTLTVGYGDIVARTPGGRFVSIVGGMSGTLITAVTIALMTDYLQLSRSEAKVVTFLRKHKYRQMVQRSAALVIQTAYRLHKLRTGGFEADRETAITRQLAKEAAAARKETIKARNKAREMQSQSLQTPKTIARQAPRTPAAAASSSVNHATQQETRAPGMADRASGPRWTLADIFFGSPKRTVPVTDATAAGNDPEAVSSPTSAAIMPDQLKTPATPSRGGRLMLEDGSATVASPVHPADLPRASAMAPFARASRRAIPKPLLIPDGDPANPVGRTAAPQRNETQPILATQANRVRPREAGTAAASRLPAQTWCGLCRRRAPAPPASTLASLPADLRAQVRLYERLLFERVETFRHTKRWVLSHDPTDPLDKQLTILETLEVHVDEIKSSVDTLSEFVLGPAASSDGAPGATMMTLMTARDGAAGNAAPVAATYSLNLATARLTANASRAALALAATVAAPPSAAKTLRNAAEKVDEAGTAEDHTHVTARTARSSITDSPRQRGLGASVPTLPDAALPAGLSAGAAGAMITPGGRSAFTRVLSTPAHGATAAAQSDAEALGADPLSLNRGRSSATGAASEEVRVLNQTVSALTTQLQTLTDTLSTMRTGFADYVKSTDARIAALENALARAARRRRTTGAAAGGPAADADVEPPTARSGQGESTPSTQRSVESPRARPSASPTAGMAPALAAGAGAHTGSTSMLPPISATARRGSAGLVQPIRQPRPPAPQDSPTRAGDAHDMGRGLDELLQVDSAAAPALPPLAARRLTAKTASRRKMDTGLATLPEHDFSEPQHDIATGPSAVAGPPHAPM